MSQTQIILDNIMCVLWMLTYTLVFISTIKNKYPAISPITQIVIAPFEFSVVIMFLCQNQLEINVACLSYIYWAFIEIAIFVLIIRNGYIGKKQIMLYVLLVVAITAIMCYFVIYKRYMFFFSYFNTFVGEMVWFFFILKKEYPMEPINLCIFFAKFIADTIAVPIYFSTGIWISSIICIALPVLDSWFIIAYFERRNQPRKKEMRAQYQSRHLRSKRKTH